MSDTNSKIEVLKVGDMEGAIAYATGQPRKTGPATTQEAPKAPATAPAATTAPAPAEDDDEDDVEALAKRAGIAPDQLTAGMRKTINRQVARRKESDERAIRHHAEALAEKQAREAAEKRIAELEAKQQPAKPATAPAEDDPEPAWQDGMDSAKYWRERDAWNRRQAIKEFQAVTAKERADQARAEQGRAAEERVTKAKAVVSDFADVTGSADLHFGEDVSEAIWQSELFPEIAYHLAKHPDEAASIRKMSIGKALLAIGRLEAKLTPFASTTPAKAAPSTAPVPPAPPPSASLTAPAPSSTRDVPVITPLAESSEAQVSSGRPSTAQAVEAFQQKTGRDLYKRRRN